MNYPPDAALWDREERYRYDERIGVLAGPLPPNLDQIAIARADVLAWQNIKDQASMNRLLHKNAKPNS